jgi:hypothetical protein
MALTIVKRKSKGFFKPDDLSTIKQAVYDVQNIITDASILLRAYYLHWFDNVKKDDNKPLEINKELVHRMTSVVQGTIELKFRKTRQPKEIVEDDPQKKEKRLKEQEKGQKRREEKS